MTQDLTEEELLELKALCEKTTPAPWEVFAPSIDSFDVVSLDSDVELDKWMVAEKMRWEENAQAIVALRNATPALIAMALRMRKLEEALGALGAIGNGYCFCSENRDPLKQEHEPECRDARAVLSKEGDEK